MTAPSAAAPWRVSAAEVAVLALFFVLAVGLGKFSAQDGLGTFADDSVSYIVLAQVLSPWRETSEAVAAAFAREAFYPPLFPLLLGLLGAGHDIRAAHVVTALLLAGTLLPSYWLGVRWMGRKGAAVALVVALALLPAYWITARGILSEPLFCLLLLFLFLVLEADDAQRRLWLCAFLMGALALTRTAGLGIVAGYLAWVFVAGRRETPWPRLLVPGGLALAAYGAWVAFRPDGTSDVNAGLAADWIRGLWSSANPAAALGGSLVRQAVAVWDAWLGSLLLFWVEGQPGRPLIAGIVGVLALGGLALRLRAGKADAWMVLAYLGLHLAWPLYDQMTRFLFPVLPVLVIYAALALTSALRGSRRLGAGAPLMVAFAIATLAGPGLAFIWQRAQWAGPQAAIVDWYRYPDLDMARRRADIHLGLAEDMERIRTLTRKNDSVMWVAPSYIALLADRHALESPAFMDPGRYRQAVLAAAPDFLLLTRFHPRDTIRDRAYRIGLAAMGDAGEVVHARRDAQGALVSVLVRLRERDVR